MALSDKLLSKRINLNVSDIREMNPSWPEAMIDDYLYKQLNINSLGETTIPLEEQVALNTKDIEVNKQDIETNKQAISLVNTELDTHESNDSAHGVTGKNVGTEDFSTSTIGGVSLIANLVTDAADSTVDVASPDAIDLATVITLANETKGDVNQLVIDLNAAITQLNAFLASNKTAKQMANI